MKPASAAFIAAFLLPLAVPSADAQNTCVTAEWVDTGDVHNVVRPEVDEYRGRITFSRQPGCPVGCPDASSTEATFEVLNQQQPWLMANFTENPVAIEGSAQVLSARTTTNEVFLRLGRSAPFETSFNLQVRARCQGSTSQTAKSFRVGPLVDVTADVVEASTLTGGAQWAVRITNSGNVPVVAAFEPHPGEEESGLAWDVPDLQLVPAAEGEASSLAVAVTVSVAGERIPGNLSLTLRMREAENENAPPFELNLPLPYTVFTGKSAPTVPMAWLLVLGGAWFVGRRR